MADRERAMGPIANLLSGSDRTLRQIAEGAARLEPFRRSWSDLLSEPARDHIRPAFFSDGKLTVWVDSPVWGNWIRHRRDSLIAGIEKQGLPNVRTLVVRLSPEIFGNRKNVAREQPSDQSQRIISQIARTIPEPELRGSLLRLARTLKRPR